MEALLTKYFITRSEWRNWLESNFDKREEVWLIYPKKSTGKPRIEYNTAVEEALCFGWIDSIIRSFDADHTMQRFTPRRKKSSFSQPNIERLKWLFDQKKIHVSVQESTIEIINQKFVFPSDILKEIKKNSEAWKNYQHFSEPYKRIRIAYIESARKRPEEFNKRISNFIAKTADNKMIKGFGGIDKYY